MKRKCGNFGSIEYRLPNIPEAIMLIADLGIDPLKIEQDKKKKKKNDDSGENVLIYIAKLIDNMGKFVSKVDITIGKKKITRYDDLLNHLEIMNDVSTIAGEILNSIMVTAEKKQ